MYRSIFDLIELGSFSSIWYWIVVAFAWSASAHWTLGVPADLVRRARRDESARVELEALARVTVPRHSGGQAAAPLEVGLVSAVLTALLVLGFSYAVEFAQAAFLLLAPLTVITALDRRLAGVVLQQELSGEALAQRLARARRRTRVVGAAMIFLTALWGTWWTLSVAPFMP